MTQKLLNAFAELVQDEQHLKMLYLLTFRGHASCKP